jgi:hypothetical protein
MEARSKRLLSHGDLKEGIFVGENESYQTHLRSLDYLSANTSEAPAKSNRDRGGRIPRQETDTA